MKSTSANTTWATVGGLDKIYFKGEFLFEVKAGLGEKAAKMQDRAWAQQAASHYTAAARISAQIERLEGYRVVEPGEVAS